MTRSVRGILRTRFSKDVSIIVEEYRRLYGTVDVPLRKRGCCTGSFEHIPLAPGLDRRRSSGTCKYSRSIGYTNSHRNVREFDIIQNERSTKSTVAGIGIANENRSVRDDRIDDGDRTDTLWFSVSMQRHIIMIS